MKRIAVVFALLVLGICGWAHRAATIQNEPPSQVFGEFQKSLVKMRGFSPDPCRQPYGSENDWHSADVESRVFHEASDTLIDALNSNPTNSKSPQQIATEELKKLERASAKINATWPKQNRFHFQILDVPPALVVKMTIRVHGEYFAFGIPEKDSGKPNRLWQSVGENDDSIGDNAPRDHLDLYPLHRGSSGHPRFLAKFIDVGCAGSSGVVYDAREWNPRGSGNLQHIIKLVGTFGLDDKVRGFEQIGKLQTEGALITLPYCWSSSVDTWDNPSLCAVDAYDLSGNDVVFRSRAYNRPDLVPVAKTIEYAQLRDFRAVLGYCASARIADAMVSDIPPFIFADDLRVAHTGNGKERIELGYEPTYRFDVENRAGEWMVAAFQVN